MKVFDDSFLSAIEAILKEKCVDSACVKAGDVCDELELDQKEFRGLISAVIRMDLLPEYRSYLGPGRGIGRKDTPPKKSARSNKPREVEIPDHFLDELQEVLADMVQPGPVARDKIVAEMETATMKNATALVSAAIKLPAFCDKYGMRVGKGGGVVLKDVNDVQSLDTTLEDTADSSVESTDVVAPAAEDIVRVTV
jgi:hypothetical protein